MKSIMYPFSMYATSITRHIELIKHEIVAFVVPGKLLRPSVVSDIDDHDKSNIPLMDNFHTAVHMCDNVIWLPYDYNNVDNFFLKVKQNILYSIEEGKDIVCLESLSDEEVAFFINEAQNHNVNFEYYTYNKVNITALSVAKPIAVPIITVVGVSEYTGKFDAQLFVRQALKKAGYRIAQIGSKPYSYFFGIKAFPSFMFEKNITENEKIDLFKRYISSIIDEEHPDVLIIGLPGEVAKINEKTETHYGLMPYLCSCSYNTDFLVLTTGCNAMNIEILKIYENILRYKFSMPLDAIYVNDIRIDSGKQAAYIDLDYMPINMYKNIKNRISDLSDVPIFGAEDDISKLSEYIESILVCDTINTV